MSKTTLAIVIAVLLVVAAAICAFVVLGGTDKAVNHLEDGATSITIDGGEFPSGTVASVSVLTGQERADALSKVAVNPEDALVYDIGAKNGGKPVQPNSRVEVKVPVSFSEDVQVYSIKNGAVTKLDSSVSGGKVVFRTNSLSTFVIGTKPTLRARGSPSTEARPWCPIPVASRKGPRSS